MPLFRNFSPYPQTELMLWKITETDDHLRCALGNKISEEDRHARLSGANSRHYAASRLLLAERFPDEHLELVKDQNQKPILLAKGVSVPVSITHSGDFAGILLANSGHPGIDLERTDRRIGRIKQKFMGPEELDFAGDESQHLEQTLIWSAKETLYKLYSRKEVDFREHLQISHFALNNAGEIIGTFYKQETYFQVNIGYQFFDNYVLTFAHKP